VSQPPKGSEHYGGRRKVWWVVTCHAEKHGRYDPEVKVWWVSMPPPATKRYKQTGCPLCLGGT